MFDTLQEIVDGYKKLAIPAKAETVIGVAKNLIGELVRKIDPASMVGAEKKAQVLALFGQFYDAQIATLPIPYVPAFASRYVFAKLRPVAMEIASEAIEYAVSLLKKE